MKIDKKYQEELIKKLSKSANLKKAKALFDHLSKKPLFWLIKGADTDKLTPLNGASVCRLAKGKKAQACFKCLKLVLSRAKKSHALEEFTCPVGSHGFCLPLVQGEALYGFLVVCYLNSPISKQTLRLFTALNNVILEKAQKELELSKLYKTIRPRAIALSTVHTIHRLISSSLNLDELLPRIARLSLQVLRAKRCLISLVDKKTKRLNLKALIDLSKHKKHALRAIKQIEHKVMRTGNIILKNKYLSVPLVDEEPIGVITVSEAMGNRPFNNFDQEILIALSEQAVGAIKNAQLYNEQENMLLGTVKSLSTLLNVTSAYPYAHSQAFVDVVLGIAQELHLSEEESRNLRFAAMLHGTGKIGIPEKILKKPAQLTGEELKIIREQPRKSVKILGPLQRLKPAIAIILHRHEKFDGTGYPDGLKQEQIPIGARIMAVVDSFAAMTSSRPYRKSTSIMEAIQELKRQSGTQFDPRVINAFLKLTKRKYFQKLLQDIHNG